MWDRQSSRRIVIGAATAVFVICCVLPLIDLIVTTATITSKEFAAVFLDARQRGLLYNTAVLGIGTAVLSTAIGAPVGVVLARVPLRRTRLLRLMLAAPVLMPPYILALAWIYLGGARGLVTALTGSDVLSDWTYSMPGAILVLGVVLYPLSMLATEAAMRRIDGRLEEAALVVAGPGRVLWRITLPLAAPGILAAGLVAFVLAISEFGVPALLRVRVYTTEVFTAFAALYDFSRAVVLAVPLLLLSVCVAGLASALIGDRLVTTRRTTRVSPVTFEAWRGPARVIVAAIVVAAVALPIAILLRESIGARSLAGALSGSGQAIVRSLLLAAFGATAVVGVALWLGYAQARTCPAVRLAAQIAWVVLFSVPSTIVGVSLIALWNRPGLFGTVYGTDGMLLLAYLARLLPVAALILAASTRTVPTSHEEAAAVSGAGWLRTMGRIVLPQMQLGLSTAWVVAFVLAFGELGASILVTPPGEATLPIRVYTIIANAPASQVAVLALLQTLVIFAPLAALTAATSLREAK